MSQMAHTGMDDSSDARRHCDYSATCMGGARHIQTPWSARLGQL